jgi:hypothetical protein
LRVRVVRAVRVSGEDYYPGDVADFDDGTARRLIEQGYGVEETSAPARPADFDFNSVGDIGEVLPTGGEGDRFAIDDLIGTPIVILPGVRFDKGRSGRLEGKDIATVQFVTKEGVRGWFTTWSGPMIDQLKQLEELKALPRKCAIEARQVMTDPKKRESGYRYYILTSPKREEARKEVTF